MLAGAAGPLPVRADAGFEKRTYPFYLGDMDTYLEEDVALYFEDGADDLPYMEISDYAKLYPVIMNELMGDHDFSLTVDAEDDFVRVSRENGFYMDLEYNSDTISFNDYDAFIHNSRDSSLLDKLSETGFNEAGEAELFYRNANATYNRSGDYITLNLADYDIDLVRADDLYFVPLQTISDFLISPPTGMSFLFNGKALLLAKADLSHATLATDGKIGEDGYEYTSEVNGQTYTVRAETDYEALYGEAVGAYIDYVDGAVILVKSTSADIALEDVTVTSSDGTALLTTLNSDSMSRYLKEDVGNGVNVSIRDSEISGSIVHDDYQRDLHISAEGTTITGGVTYSDADAWNSRWEAYSGDDRCVWYDLDPETYITETHETVLELSGGSVWNVTEESQLTTLSVSPDSTVNGTIRAASEETLEDGTVVYTDAVVVTGTT